MDQMEKDSCGAIQEILNLDAMLDLEPRRVFTVTITEDLNYLFISHYYSSVVIYRQTVVPSK